MKEKVKDAKGKEALKDVSKEKVITLPDGAYEVEDILTYLKQKLHDDKISLTYELTSINKVKITFDTQIEWVSGSVLNVIGFKRDSKSRTFSSKTTYWSDKIVKISNIDVIRIVCDIVSGSYINGKLCHTIHQFSHCKVGSGYKFIEVPKHIIYLPVKEKVLRNIQISVVDQDGNLIDFQGEHISCRIHIKKINDTEIVK